MFKIGEFSKIAQVSIRMLRYYDEIGVLKPAKIDEDSGYRMYSTEQIATLQKIVLLRDSKFGIHEIKQAILNWDNDFLVQELTRKRVEIESTIEEEQQRIEKIEFAIKNIQEDKIDIHYNVVFKKIPSYKIVSLRRVVENHFCEGLLWKDLFAYIHREKIELVSRPDNNIAFYHDSEFKDSGVDIEVSVMVKKMNKDSDEIKFRESEHIEKMACSMVYGPYENIQNAYTAFAYWLEQHREYRLGGISRQIAHIGQGDVEDPSQYLTEIQIPIIENDK